MSESQLMNASICEGVADGSCVVLLDNEIVYAGPVKTAPDTAGKLVLLSPSDFERFKAHCDRRRH